jgi:hypothetical protein
MQDWLPLREGVPKRIKFLVHVHERRWRRDGRIISMIHFAHDDPCRAPIDVALQIFVGSNG